jgi:hypothetical protein
VKVTECGSTKMAPRNGVARRADRCRVPTGRQREQSESDGVRQWTVDGGRRIDYARSQALRIQ